MFSEKNNFSDRADGRRTDGRFIEKSLLTDHFDEKYSRSNPMPYSSAPRSRILRVSRATSQEDSLTNRIIVNPKDISDTYIICDDLFVFTTLARENQPSGFIGAGIMQREWASWALNQEVKIAPYDPFSHGTAVYLASMDIEVEFLSKNRTTEQIFDQDQLSKAFIKMFQLQIFAPGQRLVFDYQSINLRTTVKCIQLTDMSFGSNTLETTSDAHDRGILHEMTSIQFFKARGSEMRLKLSSKRPPPNAIIQPDFKFEDMGIGGLDAEFSSIFRRAFASRIFPPGIIEKLGIPHVKGLLLYGPPGTGKTLIARQIGKMLNSREPKIINGPEVLNKYVGQSEENIRNLFSDAEREYKERGEESGLHIIIFDELDAICKQRGSRGDSTGTGDQVVNQLLAKMDGVDQLNNVLVIGMTNRKDMIDEALLRPGRLEVHVEISLPDEQGRQQILKIHTATMASNGIMGNDIDLNELAKKTKNFSGAEISGLVKSASSFAFTRHVKVGTVAGVSEDIENLQVVREDFMNALDEVHPAFGVSEEELSSLLQNDIINFGSHIQDILDEGRLFVEQVKSSVRTPLLSVLLHGPPGSGKSALAAKIGLASEFPFIKLLSADVMIGMSESQKIAYINRVFEDSYKSPMSIILVDKIERIIDYVAVGPRFSNSVLQSLMVLLRRRPAKNRRLLVLATTSEREMLGQMGMLDCFDSDIPVPNVKNLEELGNVLREMGLFNNEELTRVLDSISSQLSSSKMSVGIARILTICETARQDEFVGNRLIELMLNAVFANS